MVGDRKRDVKQFGLARYSMCLGVPEWIPLIRKEPNFIAGFPRAIRME